MRNVIKKISTVFMALMLVSGIYVLSDWQEARADQAEYTVNFHYTRADGNYEGYNIVVWPVSNASEQTKSGKFTANGNEGTFSYTFNRDSDSDEIVTFTIQVADSNPIVEEIPNTKVELQDGVTSLEVYIDGDAKSASLTPPENAANPASQETPDPASPEPESNVNNPAVSENPTTQAVGDDPDADYSVGMFTAIIIDVIIFAICGVGAYMILGKDKKAAVK